MRHLKLNMWLWAIVAILLGSACDDNDSPVQPKDEESEEAAANRLVNEWAYANMDYWYMWRASMPALGGLDSSENPYTFFERLRYESSETEYDKWSMLVDDYEEWVKELQGSSASTGAHFDLGLFSGTQDVFGIVRYVDKGSPAEDAGLKRGDVVLTINGATPTINTYVNLFFGDGSATYGLGAIDGNSISSTGNTVTVTPVEFQVDPVLLHKVIEHNGRKIGYLLYTQFLGAGNVALEAAIAEMKAEGIEDLVLDLRYNPGGLVSSAVLMASHLAPQSALGKVFTHKQWNSGIQSELEALVTTDASYASMLTDKLMTDVPTLGLSRLYVLTLRGTASASELIINGLKPYMDVITVGENTSGKFTASITLDDDDKRHDWAIQPIVYKSANANGVSDFWMGLPVTIEAEDDFVFALGDPQENMLATALDHATGSVVARKRHLEQPETNPELRLPDMKPRLIDARVSELIRHQKLGFR